jgi:hypothetical protein
VAIHPLLFAAYPILFLWSQNLGETNPSDVVLPLVVAVAVAAAATWLLGLVLHDRRRAALIVSPLVIGLLMYGHAATLLGKVHVPGIVQQAGWVALVIVGVVAAVRLGARRLAVVDTALDRIAVILVVVTLVLIVPFQVGAAGRGPLATIEPQADTTTAPKRDVYWLIFDRYGSDTSYDLLYGIKNDLTPWLREKGFTVLDKSHANYVRTGVSLPTTMNLAHLDQIDGLPGPDSTDQGPIRTLMQSSLMARQFKALGYRYYHLGSWWTPTAFDVAADVNLNYNGTSDFQTTLYDESAIPAVIKRFRLPGLLGNSRDRAYAHATYGFNALTDLRDEPGPKFVFGHIILPHPPAIFDRDGRFIPLPEERALSAKEQLHRQLDYTNSRIREFVDGLLALPEASRPIVILQADEGPETVFYNQTRNSTFDWGQASDEDIEVKYGILNAWFLPGGEDLGLYPTQTAINTFPILFSRYFGLDYALLPDRVYAPSRYYRSYDIKDVTDRLPSLR